MTIQQLQQILDKYKVDNHEQIEAKRRDGIIPEPSVYEDYLSALSFLYAIDELK